MATGLLRPDPGTRTSSAPTCGPTRSRPSAARGAPRRAAPVRPAHRPAARDLCRPAARMSRELASAAGRRARRRPRPHRGRGKLVIDYSAGMTKKVTLACALVHAPRLLVLDEPFEAVDPVSARRSAASSRTSPRRRHRGPLQPCHGPRRADLHPRRHHLGRTGARRRRARDVRAGGASRTGSSTSSGAAPTWRGSRGCAPRPTEADPAAQRVPAQPVPGHRRRRRHPLLRGVRVRLAVILGSFRGCSTPPASCPARRRCGPRSRTVLPIFFSAPTRRSTLPGSPPSPCPTRPGRRAGGCCLVGLPAIASMVLSAGVVIAWSHTLASTAGACRGNGHRAPQRDRDESVGVRDHDEVRLEPSWS